MMLLVCFIKYTTYPLNVTFTIQIYLLQRFFLTTFNFNKCYTVSVCNVDCPIYDSSIMVQLLYL